MPVDSQQQVTGGGKLQPVLPKPGSIFPIGSSSSSSRSMPKTSAPQMTQLAATFSAPTAVIASSSSSSSTTNVVVKQDPETPVAAASLMAEAAAKSNGVPSLTPANQTSTVVENHTPMAEVVVDIKNELTAAEIHAMFMQEVETMPAADRPQVYCNCLCATYIL